ncbi:MAG TPA: D-glycero-beta-D-manno-heptose 1,7-bisphosphate 7-phosphatase [Gammaproteobacteria bacterium]
MKLVILDRDGVINHDSDEYIRSVDEFVFIPGSIEAIARLSQAGYRVAVATNQSGISRGYFDLDTLNQMHTKLLRALTAVGGQIEMIAFCPHGPDDNCNCRKPKSGMLLDIGQRMNIPLTNVPIIGDSLRDLESARSVGARPILVRTGKGERTITKGDGLEGVAVYENLAAAVDALLREA